jgi:ATP-binding region, ATPase-like (fragment)
MNNQLTLFDRDSDYLESSVKDFDSKTASFRVHASLIYKLGESLIADEITALSELIKNAYDADATVCALSISSDYIEEIDGKECTGCIELSDNGCGMDLTTIVNGWLTLSNSPKKKMKKEQKTTPKYHRYPLGDKGLGRLSVQKIGRYMQMTTKAADSNIEYRVIIPWGDFLKNTTIDQIPVTIEKQDVVSQKSYTKIIIKDLINPEMWGQTEQISLLTNSINKIVSPFRSKKSSFHVVAQINGQPIDTENKVFDELLSSARAKHTIKYSTGTATIVSEFKNSFFYNREVLHRVMSGEFTLSETAVRDFLQTYKKDFPNVSTYFREGVSLISEDTCKFPDIAAPIFTDKSDSNEIKKSIPIDPGIFECEIYEYSLDQKFLDYLYDNISYSRLIERDEYRDFVSRYHGIKVVRDGFVIQGFGDGDGGDWLGLSSSSKTTGYFFDLRNDSVIGCVYLTGVANSVLKETTNREGFVEDEYFRAFKSILDGSIKRINRNRKKLNDFMKRYVVDSIAFSGNPSSDVLNYKPAIEQIREDLRTVDASVAGKSAHINVALKEYKTAQGLIADAPFIPLETVSKIDEIYGYIQAASDDYQLLLSERDAIGKKLDAINLDFEKMSERLQDLFELAGLGLSVEMFTHEFDSSIRSVRQKNQQIVSNRAAQTVDNLVRHINYVTYSLDALRKQMSYFNPGLKFVRAEKQIFSFKEFIKTHKSFYIERCKNKNIEFYVDVSRDFDLRLNRGMLNQVFDNLFSNAEYWLDYSAQQGLIENKQYHISAIERGIIVVWDNGIGISPDLETRLFDPFETKKKDGRGLGLYIAAGNLKYSSSRIRLLNERNRFGNLFKFEIDVSQAMQ